MGVRTKSKGHSRGNTPKHGLKEATVPHCISLVNTKNELWSDEIKRTDSPLPFLPLIHIHSRVRARIRSHARVSGQDYLAKREPGESRVQQTKADPKNQESSCRAQEQNAPGCWGLPRVLPSSPRSLPGLVKGFLDPSWKSLTAQSGPEVMLPWKSRGESGFKKRKRKVISAH